MPNIVLIDYGCHSFTYRLSSKLAQSGHAIRYFVNGSLESPNQHSVAQWVTENPNLVRNIECQSEYGKMSLRQRLAGELNWARNCIAALEQEKPGAIILSCVPIAAVTRIQMWANNHKIPFIYWLQDLQGRAIHDLLGRKLGLPGRVLGSLSDIWEQELLERSRMVIAISQAHQAALPPSVRREGRYAVLENWANIEEIPQFEPDNEWSRSVGLSNTRNVLYSGTLGLKHDLPTLTSLAASLKDRPDTRVVIVSTGEAANSVARQAKEEGLTNLIVLPFQPYGDVPKVLAAAAVLIAPLDPSAGAFCIPSKILSYLCAGRPTVLAIDQTNPAAQMILNAKAGAVTAPGDTVAFIAAVTKLLDDPSLAKSQGLSARAYAENKFSLDRVVPRFLAILAQAGVSMQGMPPRFLPQPELSEGLAVES